MSKLHITFTPTAFKDYEYWLKQDKKLLKKINSLIKSIQRDGILEGEGKPEPLKGNLKGYCSRRINHEHRLVYAIKDNQMIIIACRYHY
ncbi:Txe/YoeB family addiction module toxin [Staphylococcus agnetis]|uniref:Txe/YoeB family addiction module toxin n=1 Tax=Staphylococcus agnetis TaxID=985762 RepID=UPI00208E4B5D|nr:Txe/YoeB family addiction module toxin [Staphylococcus agnetis]MCO4342130.1 Txe/YoeB family addiction module toxin [Staphylococcus agnetis]MCO4344235.1 Txe/YoeB family addiction module toxin [Staphylococcus agnetis]MCO4360844.1 Txe/YoeB family addiction module toxin [Staphylococcus agnetis]MCO4368135.1 Txe/YoeB family addiction module toxin [Staphylococcus agnetis]MCO4372531.1 Txe/YoeB family addiction module toxin [Staphylococcus agnetis]